MDARRIAHGEMLSIRAKGQVGSVDGPCGGQCEHPFASRGIPKFDRSSIADNGCNLFPIRAEFYVPHTAVRTRDRPEKSSSNRIPYIHCLFAGCYNALSIRAEAD